MRHAACVNCHHSRRRHTVNDYELIKISQLRSTFSAIGIRPLFFLPMQAWHSFSSSPWHKTGNVYDTLPVLSLCLIFTLIHFTPLWSDSFTKTLIIFTKELIDLAHNFFHNTHHNLSEIYKLISYFRGPAWLPFDDYNVTYGSYNVKYIL